MKKLSVKHQAEIFKYCMDAAGTFIQPRMKYIGFISEKQFSLPKIIIASKHNEIISYDSTYDRVICSEKIRQCSFDVILWLLIWGCIRKYYDEPSETDIKALAILAEFYPSFSKSAIMKGLPVTFDSPFLQGDFGRVTDIQSFLLDLHDKQIKKKKK